MLVRSKSGGKEVGDMYFYIGYICSILCVRWGEAILHVRGPMSGRSLHPILPHVPTENKAGLLKI